MEKTKARTTVIVKGVSLKPEHWAMIDSHAEDSGLVSRSAGLRAILDEWRAEKVRLVAAFLPTKEPA